MQSESTGTLTAICMLIPLVSVPYFAIRGTQDLDGKLPSLDGADEVAFASTDGFGEDSLGEADAPPFPSDDSVIVEAPGLTAGADWSNPFDGAKETMGDAVNVAENVAGGALSDFTADVSDALDQQRDRARSGLGGATVRNGFPGGPTTHDVPAVRASSSRSQPTTRSGIAAEWEAGIARLKTVGMRNYRVESLKDKSVYYVTAFFPDSNSGVNLRVEGEGPHPLTALRSVLQQIDERRAGNSW